MVKRIFLSLDDNDFKKLEALKGNKTWMQLLVEPLLKEAEEYND